MWEVIDNNLTTIISKSNLEVDYYPNLKEILEMFYERVSKMVDIYPDGTLIERYAANSVVYDLILQLGEIDERYGLCAKVVKVMILERNLYQSWIDAMQISDEEMEIIQSDFDIINKHFIKYGQTTIQ